ncbi:Murein DD-endopeptidase MepM and murein hydrolase activator NlpD, contain LysM domain [Methylophaga sulfidovorans]|uniref:Murein DD-endopeptidase MepM and murein hydrolase activator NlpD, contain LysM domain n=2 Tax=Methylophaga sulfidovorans TaxID=45496 RepID=A0A1I3YHM3_9GAMM|nr:Murein DD-endopeptidase MepM and murein hydrolase activator NlpD, contain LysM domain [Methylophaga sulfidovorans]
MQVIIISSNSKTHKHWHLTRSTLLILMLMLTCLISVSSYSLAKWLYTDRVIETPLPVPLLSSTSIPTDTNQNLVSKNQEENLQEFYAKQLGGLQAETIRLKMFSERLAQIAGFDTEDFSLEEHPGQGGIEHDGSPLSSEALDRGIQQLSSQLRGQSDTLSALEEYLITKENIAAGIPEGKPVKNGWVSSFYGNRIDPFNGKKTFHEGIDIAAKEGSPVMAVADGIVSWVGERGGYGGLVEIDHGNGYVTRYAHNKTIKVSKGVRVSKGEVVALMGSTGRSTGPHVHYEVLRDGKHINPYSFIK